MDRALRSILWILVGSVIVSSFTAVWFFAAKEKLYDEYVNLETVFKANMERLNNKISSVNGENVNLKSKLEMVRRELSSTEARNKDLEYRCKEFSKERADLNKKLAKLEESRAQLEKKLKDMESESFAAKLLKEKVFLQVALRRMKEELAPKDREIEALKKDKDLLERKVSDSVSVAEILSRDLLAAKNQDAGEKLNFDSISPENGPLKDKIADLQRDIDRFNRALADKDSAQDRVAGLERELREKDDIINRMRLAFGEGKRDSQKVVAETYLSPAEVELPPIIVQKEGHSVEYGTGVPGQRRINTGTALKGKILTVNKDHNFVVVDLGKEEGVDIGASFNVERDGAMIGVIEVIQARKNIAAADIKYTKEGFSIRVDDEIAKR